MTCIAFIDVFTDDQTGLVFLEVHTPRGIGAFRSDSFATVDAALHSVAPLIAALRKERADRPEPARISGGGVS